VVNRGFLRSHQR